MKNRKEIAGMILVAAIFLFLALAIVETPDREEEDIDDTIEESEESDEELDEEERETEEGKEERKELMEEVDEEELPEDIYNSPCGYYYEKYNICEGKCPDGECIEESGSCYCQKK